MDAGDDADSGAVVGASSITGDYVSVGAGACAGTGADTCGDTGGDHSPGSVWSSLNLVSPSIPPLRPVPKVCLF